MMVFVPVESCGSTEKSPTQVARLVNHFVWMHMIFMILKFAFVMKSSLAEIALERKVTGVRIVSLFRCRCRRNWRTKLIWIATFFWSFWRSAYAVSFLGNGVFQDSIVGADIHTVWRT